MCVNTSIHSVFGVAAVVDRVSHMFSVVLRGKEKYPLLKKAFFLFDLERSLQGHGQGQQPSTFQSTCQGLSCVKILLIYH